MRVRKLNLALAGIAILFIFILFASSANAFSVTGKQTATIHPGNNNQEIAITNSGDSVLFVELTATKEQYYTSQDVPFALTENWEQKFNGYEWQRVDWVNTKYGEAIIAPHTTETVGFTIDVPEGVTEGTFYAKLEVKDTGKKEGMIVIRPVYVSQVVAHVTDEKDSPQTLVGFGLPLVLFAVLLVLIVKRRKPKKQKGLNRKRV